MRTSLLIAGCLLGSAVPVLAASPASVSAPLAQRIALQNELFEQYYQAGLKASPERATAVGDYRYNAELDHVSLAAMAAEHASDDGYLARLQAISTAGFPEQDQLSHDILVRTLRQRDQSWALKEYEMPLSQISGPHLELADLANAVPLDSVQHYDDYLARLHQIPRVFTESEEVLRAGKRDHLMQVKFLLEKVPTQCNGIIAADPFLKPLKKFPASFTEADKARLTREITAAVNTEVLPAYRQFASFVATDYAPYGRTELAITSLPEGKQRYQAAIERLTTTDLTPDQIHAIGLAEIARIQGEMTALAKSQGYPDIASFRAAIEANPKYRPTSSEQIVDDFRHYIAQMQPKLPELFTYIPGAPVTVEAIPAYQPGEATHYQTGTPDGKRPGRVSVQTSDPTHRTLVNDEATAYHEGIPGHHMQLSVAQSLKGLPKFRLHYGNSGYVEGWALYAEQLGKEVGFYQDPVSDFGRLSSELFRAVRLVVDTGIHSQGWSRDQAIAFFRQIHCVDEPMLQSETDRYIAWPGQALSYKLGQLEILKLRQQARTELGPAYDIRTFDDEILSGGALPLDLLDARVQRWIAAQQERSRPVSAR